MTAETFLRLHNYDEAWRVFDRVAELGTQVCSLKLIIQPQRGGASQFLIGEKQWKPGLVKLLFN